MVVSTKLLLIIVVAFAFGVASGSETESDKLKERCRKRCLNNGVCIDGFCVCKAGYSGDHCERSLSSCQGSPTTIPHSFLYTNGTYGRIVCFDNFEIRPGVNHITLKCVEGHWTYDDLNEYDFDMECHAACIPPCENDGTCFIGNQCVCQPGFVGPTCGMRFCTDKKPTMRDVLDKFDTNLLCTSGHELDKSIVKVDFECKDITWHATYKQLHCKPVCEPECSENAVCASPNVCQCEDGYFNAGKYCKSKICEDKPKNLKYMITESSKSFGNGTLTCEPGYKLITGDIMTHITCEYGKWVYSDPFTDNLPPRCFPVCNVPCVNGGSCVATDVCKCAEGFTGASCNKRYDTTVTGNKCHFPFKYRGQYYSSCTKADRKYPWCATEVDSKGNITNWELCYADLGATRLVKGTNAKPCALPFTAFGESVHNCISNVHFSSSSTAANSTLCPTNMSLAFPMEISTLNNLTPCMEYAEFQAYSEVSLTTLGEECGGDAKGTCMKDSGWTQTKITTTGKDCIFPFKFNGSVVYKCVMDEVGPRWCATAADDSLTPLETDECVPDFYKGRENSERSLVFSLMNSTERHMIKTELKDTARGRRCIFPFKEKGELKFHCTTGATHIPWCATKVDHNNNVIESDICLPDHDFFMRELLTIQREHEGHSSTENLEEMIIRINSLRNSVYSRYTSTLGYKSLYLLMNGHPIIKQQPHLTAEFKEINSDEYLMGISGLPNVTSFAEFFGLFQTPEPSTAKAQEYEASLAATENLMREKDMLQEYNDVYEAYAVGFRTFDLTKVLDGQDNFMVKSQTSEYSAEVIYNSDELLPSSVSYEPCEPFIRDGKWHGYGSCVNVEGSDGKKGLNCAVRTSQERQVIKWEECKIRKETNGYFPNNIVKPLEYSSRNIIATTEGEPCVFPFTYQGSSGLDRCVKEHGDPYGFCPISITDADLSMVERGGCVPDELLLQNNFSLKMMGKSEISEDMDESLSNPILKEDDSAEISPKNPAEENAASTNDKTENKTDALTAEEQSNDEDSETGNTTTESAEAFTFIDNLTTDEFSTEETSTSEEPASDTSTSSDDESLSETSTSSDEESPPETSTSSNEESLPETSTSSNEESLPETSTSSNEESLPETSTSSNEESLPESSASSSEESLSGTSTSSNEELQSETSTSFNEEALLDTSTSSNHESLSETSTTSNEESLSETSTTSNEESLTETSTSSNEESLTETSTSSNEESLTKTSTSLNEESQSETSALSNGESLPGTSSFPDGELLSETSTSSNEESLLETSTSSNEESVPETSTASNYASMPETATSSKEESLSETSTSSNVESLSETSTSSNGESLPETSTSSDGKSLSETLTSSNGESLPETSTSSKEESLPETSTSLNEESLSETSTSSNEDLMSEISTSSNEESLMETSTSSNEESLQETTTSFKEELLSETSTSSNGESLTENSTYSDEESLPEASTSSNEKLPLETTSSDEELSSETSTSSNEESLPETSISSKEASLSETSTPTDEESLPETSTSSDEEPLPGPATSCNKESSPETSTSSIEEPLLETSTSASEGLLSEIPEVSTSFNVMPPEELQFNTRGIKKSSVGGSRCVIPFMYKAITYDSCTDVDAPDFWCATKVDESGTPLFGNYCTDSHLSRKTLTFTTDGFICQFPFEYQNKFYDRCIKAHSIKPWCYTDTRSSLKYSSMGECIFERGQSYQNEGIESFGSKLLDYKAGFGSQFLKSHQGQSYHKEGIDSFSSKLLENKAGFGSQFLKSHQGQSHHKEGIESFGSKILDYKAGFGSQLLKSSQESNHERYSSEGYISDPLIRSVLLEYSHAESLKQGSSYASSIVGAYISNPIVNSVMQEVNQYYGGDQENHPIRVVAKNGAICLFPFPYDGNEYFSCVATGVSTEYSYCATHISSDGGLTWDKCAIFEIRKKFIEEKIVNCNPDRKYGDIFQEIRECFEIKKRTEQRYLSLAHPLQENTD